MNFWSRSSIALLLCASSTQAAELVHLSNGYNLHCVRHEQVGSVTRVYIDESASIDLPSGQISGYETDLDSDVSNPPPPVPTESAAVKIDTISRGVPGPSVAVIPDNAAIRGHIEQAARRTGVDPDFIESVVRIESGYNTAAISPKGARGLMQLMPATAARLGVRDSLNPAANIDGGSRYLRDLLVRYDGDAVKTLAAYNAGPQRVEQYKGVPPFRETRNYVARVIEDFNRRKRLRPDSLATKKDNKTNNGPSTVAVRRKRTSASQAPSSRPVKVANESHMRPNPIHQLKAAEFHQ